MKTKAGKQFYGELLHNKTNTKTTGTRVNKQKSPKDSTAMPHGAPTPPSLPTLPPKNAISVNIKFIQIFTNKKYERNLWVK